MAESKHNIKSLLMTADTVGGVWTYALELARGLQPYGIQVNLATMGQLPSAAQFAEAAAIVNLHLHPSSYQLEWMDDPWEEVSAAGDWLLELEKQIKPDLIHLNNYCHGHLPWQAPVLMVGHSCVLSWWRDVKGEEAPERYSFYQQMVRKGLQASDLVVAPTAAFLEKLQHYYGPFQQEVVIPNGRNPEPFNPAGKEESILSVGRLWDEAKNLPACEEAAANLHWPLEVAGDTKHPGGGQEKTYTYLKPLGRLSPEQVAAKMARAAIYVMPAKYEPFGLSILEAALSGCALLLGDIPTLRENWQGVALFADPQSGEDVREKLQFLMRHSKIRERMGTLARERALLFSLQAQAAAYVEQYNFLLNRASQVLAGCQGNEVLSLADRAARPVPRPAANWSQSLKNTYRSIWE